MTRGQVIDGLATRLCEALPDIVFLVDPGGTVHFCNRRAARLIGRPATEIVGRRLVDFVAGAHQPVLAQIMRCARSGSPLPGTLRLATPSGEVVLQVRGAALGTDLDRRLIFLQCVQKHQASQLFVELNTRLTRLTDELHRRSRLHAQLQRTLDERDVLLREVHHRVRNNLQVITSFLSLQARETNSRPARLALREAQARIRALGVIHGQLYTQEHPGEVDFSQLVPALCTQLLGVYGTGRDRVRFEVALPTWPIDLDRAVPLALLITEAVTNALKHAFPNEREGTVWIGLREADPGRRLRIVDDGIGLPAGQGARLRGSLGMRLMRALAEQIGSELELRSDQGVEVEITLIDA